MLEQVIATLAAWIVAVISAGGYFGIVESACIPLPSEIIMPFSGYLVSIGQLSLIGVATAGALGCNVGSTVAYYVASKGGRPAIERWGRYVLVTAAELDRAEHFFARYGVITVFVGRLLPVVRTFIPFPAGLARMPMAKFQIYTFLGSWPWYFGLAYIGMVLGARWDSDPTFRSMFHRFDAVIVALLAAGLAWFVWTRWRERARHKAKWPLNVPPHRPFRQTLLLSTVVIAVTALAAVVLWAATSGLWLVVHQGLLAPFTGAMI